RSIESRPGCQLPLPAAALRLAVGPDRGCGQAAVRAENCAGDRQRQVQGLATQESGQRRARDCRGARGVGIRGNAEDRRGQGGNGLYTENFLREMKVPEAKLEDVFKRVRLAVRRKTSGAQIPWETTSLEEDFWFIPPRELRRLSEAEKERQYREELAAWEKT